MAITDDQLVKSLDGFCKAIKTLDLTSETFAAAGSSFSQSVERFSDVVRRASFGSKTTTNFVNNHYYDSRDILAGVNPAGVTPSPTTSLAPPSSSRPSVTPPTPSPSAAPPSAGGGVDIGTIIKMMPKASGGHISGPGNGTSDSIPAWLSNGEFVVNAAATQQNRPLLEAINDGGRHSAGGIIKFAGGGMVPPSAPKFGFGGATVSAAKSAVTTAVGMIDPQVAQILNLATMSFDLMRTAATEMLGIPKTIKTWSNDVLEAQRNLAEVSPGMASVFARRDIDEILMNIERGQRVTDSASYAQRGNVELQRALIPIESLIDKIENYISGGFASGMAVIFNWVNRQFGENEEERGNLFFSDLIDHIATDGKTTQDRKEAAAARVKAELDKKKAVADTERKTIEAQRKLSEEIKKALRPRGFN